MEKIRTAKGTEIEIVSASATETALSVSFEMELTLAYYDELFSDPSETAKLTLLSDEGEEVAVYNGYSLDCISRKENEITAYFSKPDTTAQRLDELDAQVTDTQLALVELYEMIGG